MREGIMGERRIGGVDHEQSPLAKCRNPYNFSFIYSKILPSVSLKKHLSQTVLIAPVLSEFIV